MARQRVCADVCLPVDTAELWSTELMSVCVTNTAPKSLQTLKSTRI